MQYTKEYYEEGVAKGISGYTNFRWQPEFTIPLAYRIAKRLGLSENSTVLDFGCAKGFLVKALRLLDISAYGCDVSQYAIDCIEHEYRKYCWVGGMNSIHHYNWVIAKDVLEHLTVDQLRTFEEDCYLFSDGIFIVVPLGDGTKYIVPQYEQDITHVIRQPLDWWVAFFEKRSWKVDATTDVTGIKDSWAHYKDGNAILTCKRTPRSTPRP